MLYAAFVAERAHEYDWCSLLLDHLMNAIGGFSKRFYLDGFAKGCGGCAMFLAILYLDRLRRPPLMWGAFPRIQAWSTVDVNKVKKEDLLATGDYGKLGGIDAAYGGRHPLEAQDVMPTVEDIEEMSRCSAGISTKSTKSKRRRMKKKSPMHEDPVHEDPVHEDPVHEGPVHGPVHEGVVHEEVAEQRPELENETDPMMA
ncbi:uncharacterized protein LOC125499493 isoform X1 [Beta vulgaris subsp. vulgaris]|uniref:uncharacterized protein LOC125499493 isoform X1 n=1 Tax=Beta vulgaris subsp. vulgaris TaxID=3555 RepID=UPI002037661D|nr:uncharacterized protein LOC125499493 isoform X1 [Beta vulgaris subsp. vulgaris]XP_057252320.1 uncharacterized protein LOC125499493 isoform X1 [Beta vulgaris subsp. vulgaris]